MFGDICYPLPPIPPKLLDFYPIFVPFLLVCIFFFRVFRAKSKKKELLAAEIPNGEKT